MDKLTRHPHHHFHVSGLVIVVFFLSILLLLMLKPAVDSFILKSKISELGVEPEGLLAELDRVKVQKEILVSNATMFRSLNKELVVENQQLKEVNLLNENKINKLESELSLKEFELETQVARINQSYNAKLKENQLLVNEAVTSQEDAEKAFAELRSNSARNICCKQRVDNPEVDSYDVISNRIICSSGGIFELICD